MLHENSSEYYAPPLFFMVVSKTPRLHAYRYDWDLQMEGVHAPIFFLTPALPDTLKAFSPHLIGFSVFLTFS